MSDKDFRTELGKVRGLGSAKSGTHHFWVQRITGLALVPLLIIAIGVVIALVGTDYATARATLANPVVTILLGLLMFAAAYHMKLGMQVIIEDYVPQELLRAFLLALNIFFAFIVGAISILALLKISLGG